MKTSILRDHSQDIQRKGINRAGYDAAAMCINGEGEIP